MDTKKTDMFLKLILVLVFMFGSARSDLAKDKAECTDKLVGLASCLPYVSGDAGAKAPTSECCSGLKQVLQQSFKCLCVLVQDRNDPSLGLKINTTLALSMPSSCHAPVNISKCVDLLQLAPSSPDAKMFEEFESTLEKSNTTQVSNGNSTISTGTSSTAQLTNHRERSNKPWLATTVMFASLLWLFETPFIVI